MQLIGMLTCPFVHRALLLIHLKEIDCDVKFIDVKNKPDWFQALTPLGKVPLLLVNETVIFESMVINDYLDETSSGSYYSFDPHIKAAQRSWILFGNTLISDYYRLLIAGSQEVLTHHKHVFLNGLARLNDCIAPLLDDELVLSMLDIAYAPLFLRMKLIEPLFPLGALNNNLMVKQWSNRVLQHPSVQSQIATDHIKDQIINNLLHKSGLAAQVIREKRVQVG